jgi:hypothetical protein
MNMMTRLLTGLVSPLLGQPSDDVSISSFYSLQCKQMLTRLLTGLVSPLLGQPSHHSKDNLCILELLLPLEGTL